MALKTVSKLSDFKNGKSVIVEVDGISMGIICHSGTFFAYENVCAHQGGPACEGEVMGQKEATVSERGSILDEYVSTKNIVVACPWHGVEYDLQTGTCNSDRKLALRKFDVVVDGDEIKVEV
jgi:nitrite reductase (NADH) small subunit